MCTFVLKDSIIEGGKDGARPMKINKIKLITLMAEKNLSVNDLAGKAGISRGTLSAIKAGKTCYIKTAKALADALEVPLENLSEEAR